jgi:hypothetical protein
MGAPAEKSSDGAREMLLSAASRRDGNRLLNEFGPNSGGFFLRSVCSGCVRKRAQLPVARGISRASFLQRLADSHSTGLVIYHPPHAEVIEYVSLVNPDSDPLYAAGVCLALASSRGVDAAKAAPMLRPGGGRQN